MVRLTCCCDTGDSCSILSCLLRPLGCSACHAGVVTKDGRDFRADLVIDAAGRRSPLPGWLAAGGYQPPKEVEVDPHVTYVSRLYKQTPQVTEQAALALPILSTLHKLGSYQDGIFKSRESRMYMGFSDAVVSHSTRKMHAIAQWSVTFSGIRMACAMLFPAL